MNTRKGSVLITVLIILVIVFLVGIGFSRFSSSIRSQTNRSGEVRLSEMTVQALSVTAFNKIQFDLLSAKPSDDGRLKKILASSKPYLKETNLDLGKGEPDYSGIGNALSEPLKEQGGFSCTMHYSVDSKDFVAAGSGDAREKKGFIRLRINTTYKKLEDEFLFACPVKVSSSWIPLLSKFNLFIDNPETDVNKWRFNIVKTKPDGDLLPGSPKPIVLYNGFKLAGNDMMRVENYLSNRVGWVYFGSDHPSILNLAQGTNAMGEFFQLYETWDTSMGQFIGFYETSYHSYENKGVNGVVATVQWDKGIADEKRAGVPTHWLNVIKGTPDEGKMISNSIFRLYGIDKSQSPTLVLGKVFRGMISARGYQSSPKNLVPAAMFQWVKRNQWPEYISFDTSMASRNGLVSIATMARDILGISEQHLDTYREKYASQATQQGYNASLAFMATNRVLADPYSNFSGWFLKVMQSKRSIEEMSKLPVKIGGYNRDSRIPELKALLENLPKKIHTEIDLTKAVAELKTGDSGQISLLDVLALRGVYRKSSGMLDLNGWVLIKGQAGKKLFIDQSVTVVSNGGIILDRGNLEITQDISGGKYPDTPGDERKETPQFTLQLVLLDGNILMNTDSVDASLIANGKVLFKKNDAIIRGSVATKWFDVANASVGTELYYNQNLSLESCASPDDIELLGFKMDSTPVYLK
ncbi:MAG: hypothetical protein KKB51_05210 [Candidatus Riflebacteria bacterium]|nr:hypothetical protein [Candidatus Riflebacteria bacterium]